jgi:single-strand DNA-binding protein
VLFEKLEYIQIHIQGGNKMNICVFTGRATKDAEYVELQNGTKRARFTLAVDREMAPKEGEPNADFPQFTAFGRTAEFCEKYVKTGKAFEVRARFQSGSYTDKEGKKVYTQGFIVDSIRFAKGDPVGNGGAAKKTTEETTDDGFMAMPEADFGALDEELPFN